MKRALVIYHSKTGTTKKRATEIEGFCNQIALFTTYKLATGSMFSKMKKHIKCENNDYVLELKSRDGNLTKDHTTLLRNISNN